MALPLPDRSKSLVRTARRAKPDFISDGEFESPTPPETIEEFLARGGRIQSVAGHVAMGGPSGVAIHVDGATLPLSSHESEYVPSFVRDLASYDAAQAVAPSDLDDGTAAVWHDYEQSSIPSEWKPAYEMGEL